MKNNTLSTPSHHRMDENVDGKWVPATIPMPTAQADSAFRAAKFASPGRRLRLTPAAPLAVAA